MASALHWIPDSLYNTSVSAVVANYRLHEIELKTLPANVLFDVCYKLYKEGHLSQLIQEFSNLATFLRLLTVKDKWNLLHHCFQALMDHGSGIAKYLANSFKCLHTDCDDEKATCKVVRLGLDLGQFLNDAGWFTESETVVSTCLELCPRDSVTYVLECYVRLIHAKSSYCKFKSAEEVMSDAQDFVTELHSTGQYPNLAELYSEFSSLFFSCSNYKLAYRWSIEALKELGTCQKPQAAVSVLRHAAKACVVKRQFQRAELLIKQALLLSRTYFGNVHPITATTLIDYGFYLVYIDSIPLSIGGYQAALETRQNCFGGRNLLVAIAHGDLAYAMYVCEYNTGKFKDSLEHVEKALSIMHTLLPDDHLLLASSKRVKALILEEIAMDSHDITTQKRMLLEAQELHTSALHLAQNAFGEMNVQTAKHYGNLGRLYQSMKRFEEAREMHLKAIKIKENVLGQEDYEVALSLGHLASLYNYDLNLFKEAEELYLRSIDIGLRIFGSGYSGLEYDYRGLLRVYQNLSNTYKIHVYQDLLYQWHRLRGQTAEAESETSALIIDQEHIPLNQIFKEFTSLVAN